MAFHVFDVEKVGFSTSALCSIPSFGKDHHITDEYATMHSVEFRDLRPQRISVTAIGMLSFEGRRLISSSTMHRSSK